MPGTTFNDKVGHEKTLSEHEKRLACIIDIASLMRDQVGTGPLLTNVRNGFQTILDIARGVNPPVIK